MNTCYYHSKKPAEFICNYCNKQMCSSCIIEVEGEPFCQPCWDGFVASVRKPSSEAQQATPVYTTPLTYWREKGILQAFLETIVLILFYPSRFFTQLPQTSKFAPAFLFAFVCIILFWLPINVFSFKIIFPPLVDTLLEQQNTMAENADEASQANQGQLSEKITQNLQTMSFMQFLAMPLDFMFFYIILPALLQHALITLFRGKKGFASTLQVRCYSMAAQILLLLPFFALLIAQGVQAFLIQQNSYGILVFQMMILFLGFLITECLSWIVCIRGFQFVQRLSLVESTIVATVPIVFSMLVLTFAL